MLKAKVAEQMLEMITRDVSTRFGSWFIKLCLTMGAESKEKASNIVNAAFLGRWENVQESHFS